MDNYGVILRKLRLLNKLPVKESARLIGKSVGWLSEIENGKGAARIHPKEFERIVAVYGGEQYRKQFGIWVAKSHKPSDSASEICLSGAILKFLRKKAKMRLGAAARQVGLSACYLSCIETGSKPVSATLRDRLMRVYGYSPSSFKNFASEDKRSKNVPVRYRIAVLLKQMDEVAIEKVLSFALSVTAPPPTSIAKAEGAL